MRKYIWDKKTDTLTEVTELTEWATTFESGIENRRVDFTRVGDVNVYTSFLGVDHSFFGKGPPLVFETMCCDAYCDMGWYDLQLRYSTAQEAREGHKKVVAHLKNGGTPDDFGEEV